MAESIDGVRGIVEKALELMKDGIEGIEEFELQGLVSRAESIRATLIRNEKKIWLRTKKGCEMLSEAGVATGRLKAALDAPINLGELEASLAEVEAHARAIDEETRKRSMVVT